MIKALSIAGAALWLLASSLLTVSGSPAYAAEVAKNPQITLETIFAGEGPSPQPGDAVFVDYVAFLSDGTIYDESGPAEEVPEQVAHLIPAGTYLEVEGLIPGVRNALLQMQRGGQYRVHVPAELAYSDTPPEDSGVPPNENLVFEITLYDFMTIDEITQRAAEIREIMAQASSK